jgi:hypothetical protein
LSQSVATVIDAVVAIVTVSARTGAVRVRKRRQKVSPPPVRV